MGRVSTAKDRLVTAACELMSARGYGAIGVAEICAIADVRKGSFYHFFESKQALTVAAIEARWAVDRSAWVDLVSGDGPAVKRIERLALSQVDAQRRARRSTGAVPGCLFGNLAAELGATDEAARACLAGVFAEQQSMLETALAQAEAAGEIQARVADATTARLVLAQIEGMVLFAKLADDPAVLRTLWTGIERLIRLGDG